MTGMRLLLAAAALAAALPFGSAHASCTDDPCALECARYVLAHLDVKDPSLVCPR